MFVTGQREVEYLCLRLRAKYAKSHRALSNAAVQPGELHAPSALLQTPFLSCAHSELCPDLSPSSMRVCSQVSELALHEVPSEVMGKSCQVHFAGSVQKLDDASLDPVGGFGADEAEQHAESEEPPQATSDDYDAEEALEEEEETTTLGGDQFTPEQIAIAEAAFNQAQVSYRRPP